MAGVKMLLDVVAKNPNHINALINLGYFAIQSGQYDKAIARFEKVLEVDPGFKEAYLYLADIYVKTGKKDIAIKNLEKYRGMIDDNDVIAQVDDYIKELKK